MIFRRKKDDEAATADNERAGTEESLPEESLGSDEGSVDDATSQPDADAVDRSQGPFDRSELADAGPDTDELIDLGSLIIPLVEDLEIRVEIDSESNEPAALTLIKGDGAVQVMAFAAPRSGGGWQMARAEMKRSVTEGGGTVDESVGPFGPELRAVMVGEDESGKQVRQPVRFTGVDGPRWLLRGIFLGVGVDADQAQDLEAVFRSVIVDRGDEAMPPGAPLPIRLPPQATEDSDELDVELIEPED